MPEEEPAAEYRDLRWDCHALGRDRRDWPWLRPGIRIKVLWDNGDGESAALLAYEPGGEAPLHEHGGDEHILVLEGSQEDASGVYGPGAYLLNRAGTRHSVRSVEGCLVWIHWRKPVIFL